MVVAALPMRDDALLQPQEDASLPQDRAIAALQHATATINQEPLEQVATF